MQANRRAIRPDGQYYRQTRRQRMSRSFARGGVGGGAILVVLLLMSGGLAWWGWHGGLWQRTVGLGGAAVAVPAAMWILMSAKR